jgi:hypothetical protein
VHSRGGGHQRPAGLAHTPGEAHDNRLCSVLLSTLLPQTMLHGIVDTTRTGSGSLPVSKEHGRTCHRNEIVKTRSVSARICIARAVLQQLSNIGVSRPDTTNSRKTIWRSSSLHQSELGCVLMSPRPRSHTILLRRAAGGRRLRLGLSFHRLVLNSVTSFEHFPNMAIGLHVNSAMTLRSSKGDLIVASLWGNSKANCMLACAISKSFA